MKFLVIALSLLIGFGAQADDQNNRIEELVTELDSLIDPLGYGSLDIEKTKGSYSLDMVREFLIERNEYAEDDFKEDYPNLVEWHEGEFADQYGTAGTTTLKNTYAIVKGALETWVFDYPPYENISVSEKKKLSARAEAIVSQLKASGSYFGFDGSAQNGCASPTQYLIVLDVKGKVAYGIDLNPCSE